LLYEVIQGNDDLFYRFVMFREFVVVAFDVKHEEFSQFGDLVVFALRKYVVS
jgi:hypothetical protein